VDGGPNIDQGAVYVFTGDGGVWSQHQKLTASDGSAGDGFGISVAIHGDTMVVGAYAVDNGPEPDQADCGAAYVFTRSGNVWSQQQKLLPADRAGGDLFGFAVALSGDTTFIGAPMNDAAAVDGGAAYVFTRTESRWSQQQRILATDSGDGDAFGVSVAIDANAAVVGALRHDVESKTNEGAAYVFSSQGSSWSEQQRLNAEDGAANDQFGVSVGISGDTIVVGANFKDNGANLGQGAAYIFSQSLGLWIQSQKLLAGEGASGDAFGSCVAISNDTAVVGSSDDDVLAPNQGSIYTFTRNGTSWSEAQNLFPNDGEESDFLASYVAIDGLTIVAGAPLGNIGSNPDQGAAYIFNATIEDNEPGASLPPDFIETQIGGLTDPTAMALAPDGRIFVCEQAGTLRVIENGILLPTPFVSLEVHSVGERGLLGVAFDPKFTQNQFVYLYYTTTTPTTHNRVSRFTANGNVAVPDSELVLFDLSDLSGATNHNGGAIHFGSDGKLYIATGDNANSENSQSFENTHGKILRINTDPANLIPSDNPYFSDATVSGNNKAIWALGLRNPFTFAFQPGTGRMFINDVGEVAWEEISEGLPHSNYGWPICEGPNCNGDPPSDYREPLFSYNHAFGIPNGCAVVGAAFYNPQVSQFPSTFVGKYFFADLCSGFIRYLDPTGTAPLTSTLFAGDIPAPVDLKVGNDGSLYYLTRGGSIFRIQYVGQQPAVLEFSQANFPHNESSQSVTLTVRRSGNTSVPVSLDFRTESDLSFTDCAAVTGLANQRCDYLLTTGTLSFAAGETEKSFSIVTFDDAFVEGDESFTVDLINPTGPNAMLGSVASATVTIEDDDTSSPTTNPIDTSRYFVRQSYYDFLQRVPDQDGEDFWVSQIDQVCAPADAACINDRRVAVSAAFFVSSEFTRSGGYVYRLYKAAFGEQTLYRPSYEDFSADRARVIDGADLEQGKLDLANLFVQRNEFTTRYDPGLTSSAFVDAVLQTVQQGAGVTFNASERENFINDVNLGGRGLMLRNLADNAALTEAVFNRAFVLMQYFGYLRRDPDQGGYEFWLGILNASAQNFDGMVCAFITSPEYQRRFSSVVTRTDSTCQ
jgi:glucose/arabinose dehydrogenase